MSLLDSLVAPRFRLTLEMSKGRSPPVILFRRSGFAWPLGEWKLVSRWLRELGHLEEDRFAAADCADDD